jgi:hypothetical protein
MLKLVSACTAVTMVFFTLANARILHVPGEYSTINAGIQSAVDGDTVLIEPGTYKEGFNFNGKKITVSSKFLITGDRSFIEKTVIYNSIPAGMCDPSPDLTAPELFVIEFNHDENEASILTGIEILDMAVMIDSASHPKIINVNITGSQDTCQVSTLQINTSVAWPVSGILFRNSGLELLFGNPQLQVRNCTFINSDISRLPSSGRAEIVNNTFENCYLSSGGTGRSHDTLIITGNQYNNSCISMSGTGDYSIYAEIKGNTFSTIGNDPIDRQQSEIRCGGTGNLHIDAIIEENTFNNADISLGGTGYATMKTTIVNNTFEGDGGASCGINCGGTGFCTVTAMVDSNRFYGANFSISGTGVFLVNANLVGNIFNGCPGSAISLNQISVANYTCNLANNTIVGNGTGVRYDKVGGLNILNCIIWGNDTDLVNVANEQITYSLWSTGLEHSGSTNVFGDPKLIDPQHRNFGLLAGSPCIGKGTISPFLLEKIMRERLASRTPITIPRVMDIGAVPYQQPTIIFLGSSNFENRKTGPVIQGTILYTGLHQSSGNEITIFDISGRQVIHTRVQTTMAALDLKKFSLRAGSYIIKVVQGKQTSSLRYLQK